MDTLLMDITTRKQDQEEVTPSPDELAGAQPSSSTSGATSPPPGTPSSQSHPTSNPDAAPSTTGLPATTPSTTTISGTTNTHTLPLNATRNEPPSASSASGPSSTKRRRGHRTQSEVWKFLTLEPNPHHSVRTTCMHCGHWVPHHRKSEKARAHLMSCAAFRRYMEGDEMVATRPTWLDARGGPTKRKRKSSPPPPPPDSDSPCSPIVVTANLRAIATEVSRNTFLTSSLSYQAPPVEAEADLPPQRVHRVDASQVQDLLARFFYSSAIPLRQVENHHLQAMLVRCFPGTAPPTRQELAGQLLDRVHASTRRYIEVALRSPEIKHVGVNTWYPSLYLRDQSGMACVIGMEHQAFFMETVSGVALGDDAIVTESTTHALVDVMQRLLQQAGPRACGLVTDNSMAHRATWTQLKTLFPTRFFHGCASHALHLFVNDIFMAPPPSHTPRMMTEENARPAYPFLALHELSEHCRQIVNFFRDTTDEDIKRIVSRLLEEKQLRMPHFPPRYQWRHLKAGFESILAASKVLWTLVSSRKFLMVTLANERQTRMQLHMAVVDCDFEDNLRLAIAILDPLTSVMQRLEDDREMKCSDVFQIFAHELPDAFQKMRSVSSQQVAYLRHLNEKRFSAMYGDSHGIAYLLDPRYIGDGLGMEVRKTIEDMIFEFPVADDGTAANSDVQRMAIAQELTEYVITASREKNEESFRYKMLVSRKKTVLQFWLTDGLQWPLLQRAAVNVFSLPVSSLPTLFRCKDDDSASLAWADEDEVVRSKLRYVHRNGRHLKESGAQLLGSVSSTIL